MLRDPVDRLVSLYQHVTRRPEHRLYPAIVGLGLTLDQCVAADVGGSFRNWYTVHFSGLTLDEAERLQNNAVLEAESVVRHAYDCVGFLEDYDAFIREVSERAHFRRQPPQRRLNVGCERSSPPLLSSSVRAAIEDMNRLDILLYARLKAGVGQRDPRRAAAHNGHERV